MRRAPDPTALALGIALFSGPHIKLTRDLMMFALGFSAFLYETIDGGDRPNILYGALALMGVAAYLRGVAASESPKGKP